MYYLVGPPITLGPFSLSGQIPIERLVGELAHARQLPIVVVVVCVMGSLATRVARWQVYFLPARRVALGPLLSTLSISYMASTFLPLRAGELVRPVFLGQRERIPIPRVFGTILLEKLFDFLAIGVMLAVLVALTPSLPPTAVAAGTLIASVILLGFGFVVGLAIWREPTLRLVRALEARLPLGLGARVRLERAAAHFAEGTDSLREPRLWIPLLGWTLVTWLFAIGSVWAGVAALGVQPPFAALVFVTVATSATQAVPSSPGYVGVYHAAASEALKAFGVDPATALAIAVITHAFSYGSLVIIGLIALWTGGYTFEELLSSVRLRASSAADRELVATN